MYKKEQAWNKERINKRLAYDSKNKKNTNEF